MNNRDINYFKIFLLGFGFLSISLLWAIYNTDIPIILQKTYKLSSFVVGWVMNIDNILAILLIPIIGALSDRTITKIGKRMPYIISSLPLGAIICLNSLDSSYMGSKYPFFTSYYFCNFLNEYCTRSRKRSCYIFNA